MLTRVLPQIFNRHKDYAMITINPYGQNGIISNVAIHCRLSVRMERGGLKNTGAMDYTIASYNNYIRSSMLIKLNGATKVTGVNLTGFTVYEYSSTFGYLGTSNEGAILRSSARYIKIVKQTSTLPDEVFLSFDGFAEEVYNVQIEKGESSGYLLSETLVFDVGGGVCTTARLLLPPNYSIDGAKVPLFIWNACDGSYLNWDYNIGHNNSAVNNLKTQLQYLADEGFAVLNIYPWGSYNNTHYPSCGSSTAAVPVTLRGHKKAVEYVTSRFNVSDQHIFQSSHSGGGKVSSYYAIHKPSFNLEHIFAFAPVIDGLCFGQWSAPYTDFRRAIAHEMEIEDVEGGNYDVFVGTNGTAAWPMTNDAGKAFIMGNFEKFAKCSVLTWQNLSEQTPAQKLEDTTTFGTGWRADKTNAGSAIYNRDDLTIYGDGVPISIIGAVDDVETPYLVMREFVNQLNNGKAGHAELITLPNAAGDEYGNGHNNNTGHPAPVYYNTKANVQTRYGGTYATVPYGWWYAVKHIYDNYLNND